MGRRSINTTKSGKYMNPTDQARKEARKKELKKNKKQRQMVRAAVLKMKDPAQILDELEKIDDMEYNVLQPSPLNEKVLKEKRKKLRETLDRVLKMYDKDDPERWVDLKRQEMEYEKRRAQLISYYESVKHAQSVQVDDIPLPTLQVPDNIIYGNLPSQIPLPMDLNPLTVPMPPMIMKPPGILKKDSAFKEIPAGLDPPGVPIGPPPSLANIFEEDNAERVERPTKRAKTIRFSDQPDLEATEIVEKERNIAGEETIDSENAATAEDSNISDAPKPSSLQQRMLALSGQNIDSFMKEMEEVHRMKEKERSDDMTARLKTLDRSDANNDSDDSASDDELEEPTQRSTSKLPIGPPGTEGLLGISLPQMPTMMFRPPPLRMQGPPPLRMPPGPPPGRPQIPGAPPGPPPGLPPRMLRLPPGPPPGAPPRMMRPPGPPLMQIPAPVLSAGPQLIVRENLQGATIEAKPQIRNLSADVTRFVPSALRVKREDKKTKAGTKITNINSQKMPDSGGQKPGGVPTKDDAYMQFMQEMQGLL